MAQQLIQIGAVANDKTGDPLRSAFNKINQNFTELYAGAGGGNANTGGITFENVAIVGNTSVMPQGSIELVPNDGVIPTGQPNEGDLYTSWGQYVKIYPTWNADAPHIHISAGMGENSEGDIFLGDDWKYVQVNHNGNISIGTSGNIWEFMNDGTVSLPNNTLDGGNSSIDVKSNGAYAELWFHGVDGVWQNNTSSSQDNYIWVDSNGVYIQNYRGNDGNGGPIWNHEWSFNNDGSVSFPNLPTNNRTGNAEALLFKKNYNQKSIATQSGTEGQPTVERLVIAGGDSYFDGTNWSGEAGDLYLWAGRGANGGDIKVDAGNSLGIGGEEGGTVKVRGGSSTSGNGGFVEITAGYGVVNGGNVTISSGFGGTAGGQVNINAAGNNWVFTNQGDLNKPDGQSIFNKSVEVISSTGSWGIGAQVTMTDPNAAGSNITLILPASPTTGQVVTVKNINTGSYVTYVQTNGTIVMENEAGSVGSGVYATLSTTGAYITWIYDGSAFRIIG